jgi:acyl-coenzyme A thioesterase PaaI-like protein
LRWVRRAKPHRSPSRFSVADGVVRAAFTPGADHQGNEGVVHGGIISSVLEEAMAWAIAASGIWAVTAEMRVRFRRVLPVGAPTTVSAAVEDRRGRLVTATAAMTSTFDGQPIATAAATFMRVDRATEASWRKRYLDNRVEDGREEE